MIIGLYGGTFDPIHHGHIHLACQLKEKCHLDEVWFCPAYTSPHKLDWSSTPARHRLKMCQLATAPIDGFSVIDIEVERPGPSYTIDTVRHLIETTDHDYRLLLSDEVVAGFGDWKEIEQLVDLAPPLVGRRAGCEVAKTGNPKVDRAILEGMRDTSIFEMSGTEIRARLKNNLYCGHLVPLTVIDYIQSNDLFAI